MIFGVFVSFLTTQTEHARHSEPLLVYSSAYMAFVVAELFHWWVYLDIHILVCPNCANLFFQVWHHQHHWLWISCKTVWPKNIMEDNVYQLNRIRSNIYRPGTE